MVSTVPSPLMSFDFYHFDVSHDTSSNVEVVEDNVHAGRDVDFSMVN